MLGMSRSTTLVWIACGLICAVVAQAGSLDKDYAAADPGVALTPSQRAAAKALGEAKRLVDAGRLAEARAALERTRAEPTLAGYADLVRVHLLMKEGQAAEAHRVASVAIDHAQSAALQAALGVLQGEALAMSGDESGAELAWNSVLGRPGADDEAVRQSIQLSIVASRQRTGSLDPKIDPLILLDRTPTDVMVSASEVPIAALPPTLALERGNTALSSGRTERAVALFDHAIAGQLDPGQQKSAKLGRAHALFRARRYESAVTAFSALLPEPEARFWLARSLAREGNIDASLVEFERVSQGGDEELASWALFLMGTLYEDRGENSQAIVAFQRAARYERYPDRARDALWREGWAQYRIGAWSDARKSFATLAGRLDDPLARLRPRYWSGRAAALAGEKSTGRRELEAIAREYPLTYYGWRARERLERDGVKVARASRKLAEGTRQVDDEAIERVALLIEADLDDLARDELRFAATNARGFVDRTRVGVLLARVGDYHRANRLVVTAYADSLASGLEPGREALWWLSWPPAYRELIDEVFPADAQIDRELVWAIMREESHYRVDARSAVGALGLLQLMPATAAQLARERGLASFESEDLFDPKTNITLGSAYLAQLGARFDGRLSAAIGSYNAGPSKVSSWLTGPAGQLEDDVWVENIPYDQTRAYVKRVLRSLHVYKTFYR
jgi:soluble lytic murein transglycosylase-like protein/predicted negative regulator of RcsB-dependent stress response/TolA-binding protein